MFLLHFRKVCNIWFLFNCISFYCMMQHFASYVLFLLFLRYFGLNSVTNYDYNS